MSPTCKLCQKEMTLDSIAAVYDLYCCNLCQGPELDSMYKEVYENIYDGNLKIKQRTGWAVLVDKYYVMWSIEFGFEQQTRIFKDITGTVANSVFLYPITEHSPIATLPFLLELPLHDLPATLQKLQTITIFS